MTSRTTYGFMLWAVPRFHRSVIAQPAANNSTDWPAPVLTEAVVGALERKQGQGALPPGPPPTEAPLDPR
jgi:hypothetical protein